MMRRAACDRVQGLVQVPDSARQLVAAGSGAASPPPQPLMLILPLPAPFLATASSIIFPSIEAQKETADSSIQGRAFPVMRPQLGPHLPR
eukprot:COSAG01_NODE_2187_length_8196_cov_76.436458_10_plen_90_part_00